MSAVISWPTLMLHIAVEREGQPRKELRFAKDSVVVGREAEHDLQLNFEDGASRQHCRIFAERGQVFVEDLGSRNGTKVNGKRIAARTPISGRDEVEVGKVKLRLVEQAGAARPSVKTQAEPAEESPTTQAPARPRAKPAAEPAPKARSAEPAAKPAARAAPEPAPKARQKPDAEPADGSIKVNLKSAAPEPEPAAPAEPEGKPSGPVHDENEACRSQIDPLARRWRDLGRPEGLLLHGPLLARGLAWVASDRKLRPRPSELHREFIYASRTDRRHRLRDAGALAGAFVLALTGGSITARALHKDLVLKDAGPGQDNGAGQCMPDNPAIVRANELAKKAADQTDPERAILAGVRALVAADGPCAYQSDAEPVLRNALSRQRSRVIGRVSPIRGADVGRGERDVVTVDDSGTVTLWDRTGASSARTLTSSASQARIAVLGPEERWLAVGTASGAIDLWDLDQRAKPVLAKQLDSHREPITAIAFSDDGRYFASGDRRGNIKIWDMRGTDAGNGLGELRAHKGEIDRLEFRDGGTRLFSFGGKQVYAWDLQDGRRKGKEKLLAIGGDATAMAVNGEGDEVVVGDSIGQVLRWKVRTLATAQADALAKHDGAVLDLAFIPKERAVLSLGSDNKLIVTELSQVMREGSEPLQVGLRGLQAEPLHLAADPTGRRIAVSAKDHKIYVWDVQQRHTSAQPVAVFDEHVDTITALQTSYDGNVLLSAAADGTLRQWPLQSTEAGGTLAVLSDHRGPVLALGLGVDGSRLLSAGGQDKTVRAWRLDKNGAPRRLLERTYDTAIRTAALSGDGRWAAVGVDRQVLLYNLGAAAGDRELRPIERSHHNDVVSHIAFSANGEWMVTADDAGTINTWPMRQDGPEDSPANPAALGRPVTAIALSPTSPYYAVAGTDNRVTMRAMAASGGTAEHQVAQHEKSVLSLTFSPGGDYLVSTSEDFRAILRKVDKGKTEELAERSAIAHNQRIRAAAFSYDKRWLATGSDDGVINMTDLAKATERIRPLTGHEAAIVALAFEPSSELLVSASVDKTVRLWFVGDLDRGGEVRQVPLAGHGAPVTALRLDGGQVLVSGGADGQIRIWPLRHESLLGLACRTVGRDFREDEWADLYPGDPLESLCGGK